MKWVLFIIVAIGGLASFMLSRPAKAAPAPSLKGNTGVLRVNRAGIDLIKRWETFSPIVYNDPIGLPTIGWGHLIKPGESFSSITPDEGEELLRNDMADAERFIKGMVSVPLNENQYSALVSLAFNVKHTSLRGGTIFKKLNRLDYAGAADEFRKWVYAGSPPKVFEGLRRRRESERQLFLASFT